MTINTKYNEGDNVWLMLNNKPHQTSVKYINATVYNDKIDIRYGLSHDEHGQYVEDSVFTSKEDLVKSL